MTDTKFSIEDIFKNITTDQSQLSNREKATQRAFTNLFDDLGVLNKYFNDTEVTDIIVQTDGRVIIKKFKKGRTFTGDVIPPSQRWRMVLAIASVLNIDIDLYKMPKLEGTIPYYKSRVEAILPPWVDNPFLAIRKPPLHVFSLEDYREEGRLSHKLYKQIIDLIRCRKNILIGGSTGSGKTTFANALLKKMCEITPMDNFYIVEDASEILCEAEMHTKVLIKPEDAVEAVRIAMRVDPDRIIFGEIRYGEVVSELLKAWNTGHRGNFTTIHADNCMSMIRRIEDLLREVTVGQIPNVKETINACIFLRNRAGFGPFIEEVIVYGSGLQHDSESLN